MRLKTILSKALLFLLLTTAVGPMEMGVQNVADQKEISVPEFQNGTVRASTLYTTEKLQLNPLMSATIESVPMAYEPENVFLSNVLTADFPFDAVSVEWEESLPSGTKAELSVRFQEENGDWSEWIGIQPDINDNEKINGEELTPRSGFVSVSRSIAVQYKVILTSDGAQTPRVQNVNIHYIDASLEETESLETGKNTSTVATAPKNGIEQDLGAAREKLTFASGDLEVISREEWGADESWRLADFYPDNEEESDEEAGAAEESETATEESDEPAEKSLEELYPEEFELVKTVYENDEGEELYWPLEYSENVDKIVIHHTASTSDLDDPGAAIRAIYYYHAVRRGWGDIGYNYIIDTEGNVYEGRYGGEQVVGGHARGYNTGSIGIAVLGNYDTMEVPFEVLESLSLLIAEKADHYNIDVDGFSRFRGEVSANILGHRDVAATACPGQNLYESLSVLRKLIANGMTDTEGDLLETESDDPYAFANTNAYDALIMDPDDSASFELKLKNVGQETWNGDTYLVANKNSNAEALVHFVKQEGNTSSIATMVEDSVNPGGTATFLIQAESGMWGGFESFDVTPIFNGITKTSHYLDLPVYVSSPTLSYEVIETNISSTRIEAGETVTVGIEIKNTGNANWYRDGDYPLLMGTASPRDRESAFLGEDGNRYGSLNESVVAPGEIGSFTLELTAPISAGSYYEVMAPVMEGVTWLQGDFIEFNVLVYDSNNQAVFVDSSDNTVFAPGETQDVWMDIENIGYLTWPKSGDNRLAVGTIHHPDIGVSTPVLEDSNVEPGETGRIEFEITAPDDPGTYTVLFRPRLGKQNLSQTMFYFKFTVLDMPAATSGAQASTFLDQEEIRIKLSYKESEAGSPVITADGDFRLFLNNDEFLSLDEDDEVEVRAMEDRYQIVKGDSAWVVDDIPRFIPDDSDTVLEIVNYENRPAWNPDLNDNLFRGVLEVRLIEGELIVVNELPMEMYLRGVAESTNNEPAEKIRTMAILARTYARYYLTEAEKFPGMPYDLSDDPDESQKYLGYGLEIRSPNIVQAVEDTQGLVVTYNDQIVKTPYFSSTDGTATKSAEEVWGWTNTPYLVSVPDPLCESTSFNGHGVGLSGCGATAAAENGYTYEDIIKYYYPGVEVEVK